MGNVKIRLDLNEGNGANGTPNDGDEFLNWVTGPDLTYPNGESIPYDYDGGDGPGSWEWEIPDEVTSKARSRGES